MDTAANQREVEGQLDQLALPSLTPLGGFSLESFGPSCILGVAQGWWAGHQQRSDEVCQPLTVDSEQPTVVLQRRTGRLVCVSGRQWTDRRIDWQTNRQTDSQMMDRQTGRHLCRQIDRQTTNRQTDLQLSHVSLPWIPS